MPARRTTVRTVPAGVATPAGARLDPGRRAGRRGSPADQRRRPRSRATRRPPAPKPPTVRVNGPGQGVNGVNGAHAGSTGPWIRGAECPVAVAAPHRPARQGSPGGGGGGGRRRATSHGKRVSGPSAHRGALAGYGAPRRRSGERAAHPRERPAPTILKRVDEMLLVRLRLHRTIYFRCPPGRASRAVVGPRPTGCGAAAPVAPGRGLRGGSGVAPYSACPGWGSGPPRVGVVGRRAGSRQADGRLWQLRAPPHRSARASENMRHECPTVGPDALPRSGQRGSAPVGVALRRRQRG